MSAHCPVLHTCSGWISEHERPFRTVATKLRPLALQVCTSKPMTLKQYHTDNSNALILRVFSFITIPMQPANIQISFKKQKEEESENSSSFERVPMIGVEPTRREALAPETSVSTISPHGHEKAGQRYKMFLNLKGKISSYMIIS